MNQAGEDAMQQICRRRVFEATSSAFRNGSPDRSRHNDIVGVFLEEARAAGSGQVGVDLGEGVE